MQLARSIGKWEKGIRSGGAHIVGLTICSEPCVLEPHFEEISVLTDRPADYSLAEAYQFSELDQRESCLNFACNEAE